MEERSQITSMNCMFVVEYCEDGTELRYLGMDRCRVIWEELTIRKRTRRTRRPIFRGALTQVVLLCCCTNHTFAVDNRQLAVVICPIITHHLRITICKNIDLLRTRTFRKNISDTQKWINSVSPSVSSRSRSTITWTIRISLSNCHFIQFSLCTSSAVKILFTTNLSLCSATQSRPS